MYSRGKILEPKVPDSIVGSNGMEIKNRQQIANSFNNFFITVGSNLQQNIPPSNDDPADNIRTNVEIPLEEFASSDAEEIIYVVHNMKNVGAGLDGINAKIFKRTFKSIINHLTHFINICLSKGIFPKQLKVAVVKPIYKGGERKILSNYRPISILPYISKILEKLIYIRLMAFLQENDIINECQYGFQKGLSTYMPLILLQEKITKAFEKGRSVVGIYLDLRKAFDTVDIEILLSKLKKYKIDSVALKLIRSYVSERTQCVKVDEYISDICNVNMGVPQGSILGPLLFILYINDFPSICINATCLLYADDTALFFESNDQQHLQSMLDSELPKINEWLNTNKLSLNTEKTYYQLYSNTCNVTNVIVSLNGKNIKPVDKVKYLGVYIDDKLSWKYHINHLANILSRNVGILYRCKFFFERKQLMMLYNSLVLPYINYCCIVWGHTFPSYINKLALLQKKAVRIIIGSTRLAHTNPIFVQLNILKIDDIVKQQALLLIHKKLNGLLPQNISELFTLKEETGFNTRRIQHIVETFTDKRYRTNTIGWVGPRLWNSIAVPIFPLIQNIPNSKNIIKNITKSFFMQTYVQADAENAS